jgi:hypothetical protein
MIDQQIDIATKDGKTTTFITYPERGGPFPVIIFYMDAPAIREELRDMARRLGTSGYYVMLPNMYYRSGVMELGPIPPDPEAPERKQMFGYMNSINIPMVMEIPYPSVFALPASGAAGEMPSLASSAAIRPLSASFSSRARRAMSLTASNSSRLTRSRSRRMRSAWLRMTVSTSRLTPWAAPAASFIKRPISSKNRLLVWVIWNAPVAAN